MSEWAYCVGQETHQLTTSLGGLGGLSFDHGDKKCVGKERTVPSELQWRLSSGGGDVIELGSLE
jgi:hypothetical protein